MSKIKFKMGDDVAHIDNPTKKIKVRSIVYKDGMLSHIVCSWWEGNEYIKDNFHSSELIPWSIAEKGEDAVKGYISSLEFEKKIKDYSDSKEN